MTAIVREIDGQLVLDDPDALAVIGAIEAHNLLATQRDRVSYFKERIAMLGLSPTHAVIVVLDDNDPVGSRLAEMLMPPGWAAQYRERGETPIARGLAERAGIQEILDKAAPEVGARLRGIDGVAVVIVTHGVIVVEEVA